MSDIFLVIFDSERLRESSKFLFLPRPKSAKKAKAVDAKARKHR